MRTSLPEAETRMPVSTGRVSSREAEPETLIAVSTNALSGSEIAEAGSGSGNGGKSSARSVRMWKRGVAGEQLDVLLGGSQLE